MRRRVSCVCAFVAVGAILWGLTVVADDVPLELSRPDGKSGDMSKPVKVYILAGQSNMVGMGDLGGARPCYPSVFLSADPAIIPGTMPIGGSAIAAHHVFRSADGEAESGATAAVFAGAYDPNADYTKLTPVKTSPVALGTVAARLPSVEGPYTVVVNACVEVPSTGTYTLHAGFEGSSHAVVTLDGKEVYRKDVGGRSVCEKVHLVQGRRYPIRIIYFEGGSAAFWMEQVELPGRGDLETVTKTDGKFAYLLDAEGKWVVRDDVYFQEARIAEHGRGCLLSASANGRSIGPEVGFGWVMGTFHDEQVLLIKTAMGNRSLNWDFRPPSSGETDRSGADKWEGLEYRLMVKGVRETLAKLDKVVPGYQGQGYEVAGFGWFQGHKDKDLPRADYEAHLVNLIADVRKEFAAPKMPVVVATVGFGGYRLPTSGWQGVWEAQMAVGDPKLHPELAGTVASVDTRDFWREVDESPRNQDYHYNRNAETYMLVGEAMGRAMVRLEGGRAAAIPTSDREARTAARVAVETAKSGLTADRVAAHAAAIKPLILEGALAAFAGDPKNGPLLRAAFEGVKPARFSMFLNDALDEAVSYYQTAGVRDYDWKPFGGESTNVVWDYFSLALADAQSKTNGIRDLKEICPSGATNWYATDFNAGKAGWARGVGPFGVEGDEPLIPTPEWYHGSMRGPARTAIKGDVLLLRRSFELPPLKDDHRYRLRIGGSIHANAGEGYAIYVNGRLLADNRAGLTAWRRTGHLPRGGHITADFRNEFKHGKVTLAIANFPMNNRSAQKFIPARAPLTVWLEEQKLPPLALTDTL